MSDTQRSIGVAHLYCPTCERAYTGGERCPDDNTKLVRLAADVDPLIGKQLDGRYTIIDKLGEGGMGAVYRASQHSVGREVAVKVLSPRVIADPDAIRRFLREAKLASRLAHPNAVGVLDFGQTDDGLFYLAMELVLGRTFDVVLKEERVLTPSRLVRIGVQICDALEGAHALAIVHRDLKPSNIMLLAAGRDLVKVLDFGLAKSLAPDQTSTTMTGVGEVLGTPAFMPPELATGQPCDGRADLYSLGCVLYLAGSGQLPFVSASVHELIAMHGHAVAPPMPGVSPQLGVVIDRLLAKAPADRYQTAAETRDALEAALASMSLPSGATFSQAPSSLSSGSLADAIRIGESATVVGVGAAAVAVTTSTVGALAPRRRWPVIVAVAGAVTAVGVVIAVALGGGTERAPALAAPPAPPVTVTPLPEPPPPPAGAPAATLDAGVPAALVEEDAAVPATVPKATLPTRPHRTVTPSPTPKPPASGDPEAVPF